MAFKLTLVSDVRQWLKGTADVEKSLDDIADSLDELAANTEQSADKAGDDLSRKFSDSFDKVKQDAKSTGRKIGDDLKDGTDKGVDGAEDFKQEAKQSAREAAASFSDVNDVLDLIQEVAANAFEGFGPAGQAAGLLAAIGIGVLLTNLENAKEKAVETKEGIVDLSNSLKDAGKNSQLVTLLQSVRDILLEVQDHNILEEALGQDAQTKFQQMTPLLEKYGLQWKDVALAMSGNEAAIEGVRSKLDDVLTGPYRRLIESGRWDFGAQAQVNEINDLRTAIEKQADIAVQAKQINKELADAGIDPMAEAMRKAAEAADSFGDSLTDNLSVADEGLDDFVKNGKLNLKKWAEELSKRKETNALIKDFAVDVDTKLSPEALENFEKLPTETQAQIAKAYTEGSKKDRKKIRQNLELEARVENVAVDTSGAQATANKPIEIPTTIVTTGLPKDVEEARHIGQTEANREANKIELKVKIDTDELQREVNRAAASIQAPTIYVNVKPKKEVP